MSDTYTVFVRVLTNSDNGSAFRIQANDKQIQDLSEEVSGYNEPSRKAARGGNSVVTIYSDEKGFVEAHNAARKQAEDTEGTASDWGTLQAWVNKDGVAFDTAPEDIILFLKNGTIPKEI